MLSLSGIQHYVFCPRQWALIALEQIWDDNSLSMEGSMLHANVDNPFLRQTNGSSTITLRGIRMESTRLGFSGIADAVEIVPFENAPSKKEEILKSRMFTAMPVEYKRGHRKISDCDRMQVVVQAMMLEEILGVEISRGAIFYWQERHREYIDITEDARQKVIAISAEMHEVFSSRRIPKATKTHACKSCSIVNQCMPQICRRSADDYIASALDS